MSENDDQRGGANDTFISESAQSLLDRQHEWSLPQVLRRQAAAFSTKVAIQFEDGGEQTYAQLLGLVETLAANLLAKGVSPGDRVAIMMENSIEQLIAWLAVNCAGAIEVPVNTALKGGLLSHVLNNCAANIVIIDSELCVQLDAIKGELGHVKLLIINDGDEPGLPWPKTRLRSLLHSCNAVDLASVRAITVRHDDPAAIMYTSGTTGPAKGVLLSHGQMFIWARHMADALRLTARDVFFVNLPMFHANAQIMQVYASILAGAKVALYKRFSASRWVTQAIESGATVSSLLGVMAQFIFNQQPSELDECIPISRMITIPMPAAIARAFGDRFNVECIEGYGMTEICLPMIQQLGDERRLGSCGKALDKWYEVAVVDPEDDRRLPPNTAGEIVVRPKYPWTMMMGYYDQPDRTVKAWRNLWFHTGDGGKVDDDGFYYFIDRLQDRIRRRGENISSFEIELVVSKFDAVLEVAAVAVPAEEGEDEIKICVVTRDGTLDYMGLLSHCRKHLAYFAVPRYFHVFADFPKTTNGKVLKRELATAQGIHNWDRVSAGIHISRDS